MGKGSLVKLKAGFFRLQYAVKDSLLLADLMYKDTPNNLYLKRKKDIFDRFRRKYAVVV